MNTNTEQELVLQLLIDKRYEALTGTHLESADDEQKPQHWSSA